MKIKAVKMKHFGRFSDRELEFGEGLNIIEGDNEAGKSTVHAFIRGMLFGIDKLRGRAGKNDVYTRYLPWDSPGAYQGSIDIEHEGRNIRISRVFLQNAKSCTAGDIDNGTQIELGEAGITTLIGKLTPSAFDNTVSCAQQQLKSREDFGSYIRSYIANMADSRDSRVDVAAALGQLEERAKDIGRRLKDTDETAAREALDSLLEDEKDESFIIADRDETVSRIAAFEDEKARLEKSVDPETLRKKYELTVKLAEKLKKAALDREEAEKYTARAAEYAQRLEESEKKLSLRRRKLASADDQLEAAKANMTAASTGPNDPEKAAQEAGNAEKRLEESIRNLEEQRENHTLLARKAGRLLMWGGIIAAAGLAAALIFNERSKAGIIIGVVLMLAGLAGLLIGCVESRTARNFLKETAKAEEEEKEARQQTRALKEELENIRSGIAAARERLQKAELEQKSAESDVKETLAEGKGILERKEELEADIRVSLGKAEKERREVFDELEKTDIAVDIPDDRDPAGYLESIGTGLAEEIKSFDTRRRELDESITAGQKELARIEGTLQQYGDIGERIDEASRYLEEVTTLKKQLTDELEAVKTAISAIKEISDDLKGSFDRKINELLGNACSLVTSGKYTKARITADCEPEIMGDSGYIPVRLLSVGAGEQVFLAFRLAMAEFIFENDEIPLIFDEVFAYYDDTRLRSALEALSRLKDRQILLFACSGRERHILDGLGVGYRSVRL